MTGVVKFVSGIVLMAAGLALQFTPFGAAGFAIANAGFALVGLGALEEASKLFIPSQPKSHVRMDVEYTGTVTPRRIIFGRVRVGAAKPGRIRISRGGVWASTLGY